jgi:tellurite resistance protein TehA-like permease
MDTRYQPEGLSFDNKNFDPSFNAQQDPYPQPSDQKQDQNPSSSTPPPQNYTPLTQQPTGPVSPPSGPPPPAQYGLPTGPRLSGQNAPRGHMPQMSQQSNNYSQYPQAPQYQQQTPQWQQQPWQQQQYQPQQFPQQQGPVPQYNPQSGPQLQPASGETTRTNTWVQTPAGPFPAGQGYFPGPVDANGYPVDYKGNEPRPENPFGDPPQKPSPVETVTPVADPEKLKHEEGHGHDGWDYHTKIPHKKDPNQPYLPFGERLRHFTWAWYTLTMATGGISTLISIQPHPFPGLITIGAVFFIINLIFFFGITGTMVLRFTKFPGAFKASITHEREGLFLGPFFLSIATIITGTQKYIIQAYEADHPNRSWAVTSIAVAFWVYTFATFCLASFQYSFLFCAHTYKLTSFMPSWLLPVFPVMLAGTIASVIAQDQPVSARMPIIVAGLGCQGLGFTMAIIMYAHYIGRLMQVGYPGREHRGAMFIGVGPPSFTCLALIGMANALPDDLDIQGDGLLDAHVLRTMALCVALFLWVLAMWFFMITLVAVSCNRETGTTTETNKLSGLPFMGTILPLGLVGHGFPQYRFRHCYNFYWQRTP